MMSTITEVVDRPVAARPTADRQATDEPSDIGGGDEHGSGAAGHRLLVAVLVAVNLPILVGTTRALARGWQPLGDNGFLLVRARDVATSHHPLLGTSTSASMLVGDHFNNPGPLYFDVIAPAIKLLGPWAGLAVGVMLVNMAASSLAVVAARRISGPESMVAVAVVTAALQWTLGSELLFDVWQPNALVLPFLAFLVVVTVLATGDLVMVPWVAGVGSFIVQTHMSQILLVAGLTGVGAALALWNLRQRGERPAWRRPARWTAAVLVLAWIQPVIEQFFGPGRGNLSRIAGAATASEVPMFGGVRAVRITAQVVIAGPWFTRSSYEHGVPWVAPNQPLPPMPSTPVALVMLGLVVVGLIGLAYLVERTGRRPLATMAAMAAIALVGAVVSLKLAPINIIGISAHQLRWLWPVAALVTAAGLTALLTAARSRPAMAGPAVAGGAALALAVALANLPTHPTETAGPATDNPRLRQAQELVGQLDSLRGRGPVRFDPIGLRYADPFSGLVLAELQDLQVPFVVDDEVLVRQLGEGRRDDGRAEHSLREVEGAGALEVPPGAERVAFVDGLSPAQRRELRAIEERQRDGDPLPDDRARQVTLEERRGSGAVALFLEPVP